MYVKVRNDATPDALCGRLENLVTCKQSDFTSARELFELIARDIESCGAEPPTNPSADRIAEGELMDMPWVTLGTVMGVAATVAIAWINQKTLNQRELLREEIRTRETLYGEFIGECARLLVDAFQHTLEKPETLLPAYALLNRIRMSASHEVLAAAERLLGRITDQYFSSNLSPQDLYELARSAEPDPLKEFGEACRAELKSIRAALATKRPRLALTAILCTSATLTDLRPNADASLTTPAQPSRTLTPDRFPHARTRCLYNSQVLPSRAACCARFTPHVLARAIAATLSASLVLSLGGCATPMLDSTVAVPDQFAAAPASETAAEVAWWERYGDPVLSDLIRRAARENRDIKIAAERVRAARAGETISRSSLLPSFGAVGSRGDQRTDYSGRAQEAVPDMESASGGLSVSWEVDLSGRLRAGAAAAAADTNGH